MMWVEKYRPRHLVDVVGQEIIIERLIAFVHEKEQMPHLLLAGPPGVGKTSTAIALARALFGRNLRDNYKELNASDERGIKMVREDIKKFASIKPFHNMPFRLLVLDEADNMTRDAQQALRRTMEKYKYVRFVLIANYSSRIILPIQSRTAIFRFRPVPRALIQKRVTEIAIQEKLTIPQESMNALIDISKGDLRRVLNLLQSVSIINKNITPEMVFEISGLVDPSELLNMIQIIDEKGNGAFYDIRKQIRKYLFIDGISGRDLVNQIYSLIVDTADVDLNIRSKMTTVASEVDYRLTQGCDEEIQLMMMLNELIVLSSPSLL